METIECLKTRRSKRLFINKRVSTELINKILECAIAAPSSKDCQPWDFIVIKDSKIKKEIADLKEKDNQEHIILSDFLIIVCVNTLKSPKRWLEDGVCAAENILIACHGLGLGSVYVTGFSADKPIITKSLQKILNIPEIFIPIVILPIGYPNQSEILAEKAILDLTQMVHYDRW